MKMLVESIELESVKDIGVL